MQKRFIWDFFHAIHLVWIQKLKQPMIFIKVMTENRAYCGFQGWLQVKEWKLTKKRAHTLLVTLHYKQRCFGFAISTSLINYLETYEGPK